MVSRRPFCPPWPPSNFNRAVPGGRSSSSWASNASAGSIFQKRRAAITDLPERFMKVPGLSSQTTCPSISTLQLAPNSLASTLKRPPNLSAKASHRNADSARCGRDRGAHRTTVLLGVLLDLGGRDLGRTGVVARLRLDAALACDDHGHVVLLAQLQLGDLDALGQLQRRQVDDLVDGQLGQVDLDELRQVLRQAAD